MKAEFWKGLFHAFLFSLCLIGIFGVLLPVAFGFGFADMKFSLFLALVPFAILCPNTELGVLLIFVLWALYLGLMTASLWGVRKAGSKTTRVISHIVIIITFGTSYAVGWYLTGRSIAEAVAIWAMVGTR